MDFKALSLAAALAVGTSAAEAATYVWSYAYAGGESLVEGFLDGALQEDGDTILVTQVSGVTIGGTPAPQPLRLASMTGVALRSDAPPSVTLSGAAMDICATNAGFCSGYGVHLDTGAFGQFFYATPDGANDETYAAAAWSIAPLDETAPEMASAPLPGAFWLLAAGLGGVALLRRRT